MKITQAMIDNAMPTCVKVYKKTKDGKMSVKYIPAVYFNGGGNDDEPIFLANRKGKYPRFPSSRTAIWAAESHLERNIAAWKAGKP